jgi:origin recognition complex subunit 5
MNILLTAT